MTLVKSVAQYYFTEDEVHSALTISVPSCVSCASRWAEIPYTLCVVVIATRQ